MAAKTISIEFDGYWRDENKGGLPANSGVYCVYECTYNAAPNQVTLKRLIYIGEAGNVRDRVSNHEKRDKWLKYIGKGNELCFSFGGVGSDDRDRAEAAMIFKHKPPVNDEYKNSFPFDKTTMSLSGKTGLLNTSFTVDRT